MLQKTLVMGISNRLDLKMLLPMKLLIVYKKRKSGFVLDCTVKCRL